MAEEIVPGGQAVAIGLEPGDTIVSYDGQSGLNQATFIRAVQAPGEGTRELRIRRRGAVLTFQVQPGKLGIHLVDRAVQGEETPSPGRFQLDGGSETIPLATISPATTRTFVRIFGAMVALPSSFGPS